MFGRIHTSHPLLIKVHEKGIIIRSKVVGMWQRDAIVNFQKRRCEMMGVFGKGLRRGIETLMLIERFKWRVSRTSKGMEERVNESLPKN